MVTTRTGLSLVIGAAALLIVPAVACDGDLGDNDSTADSGNDSANDDGADDGNSGGDAADGDEGGEGDGEGDGGSSCGPNDCGPAPGAPNYICPDGETVAGPGGCIELADGTCGWEFIECPPCTEEQCGPAPGAPNMLCPDGVNESGPGPCTEIDGVCGYPWIECPACCDPGDQPQCFEGATCCADGTWACNEGDGTPTCEGETALPCMDGGQCSDDGESCASGETCCDGLQCCSGIPVPEGQEFCGEVCPISDKNKKENFLEVDTGAILRKVNSLEITTWNYKAEDPRVRHLGPMAQDFKAAFSIGATDKAIFQVDADGVALASIQGLSAEVDSLKQENAKLRKSLDKLQKRLAKLESKR